MKWRKGCKSVALFVFCFLFLYKYLRASAPLRLCGRFPQLHVEAELHDVAVLDLVFFALDAEFAGFAALWGRTE